MTDSLDRWRKGVTIGMPIYNEERFVEAAIRSAALQCETLLISDNCSTDRTAAICERLSSEFDNITFIRQAQNIGAAKNFEFLLQRAETPFFMWFGGHDLLPQNYVNRLRENLDAYPESVLAYGSSLHVDRQGKEVAHYEYQEEANPFFDVEPTTRLIATIQYLDDCSLFHGLFRTEALKVARIQLQYIGADHVLLSRAIQLGQFTYEPATFLIRRDVHVNDTQEAQLDRITGGAKKLQASYKEMQQHQYALAVKASEALGWKRIGFRLHARYLLVHRFGPFSEKKLTRLLDNLIWNFLLLWRKIERLAILTRPIRTIGNSDSRKSGNIGSL